MGYAHMGYAHVGPAHMGYKHTEHDARFARLRYAPLGYASSAHLSRMPSNLVWNHFIASSLVTLCVLEMVDRFLLLRVTR